MVTDPPKVNERGMYPTKEAAALLGISRRTLLDKAKLGARHGGIDCKVRRDNGRRSYSGREIMRFWSSQR